MRESMRQAYSIASGESFSSPPHISDKSFHVVDHRGQKAATRETRRASISNLTVRAGASITLVAVPADQ